MARAKARRSHTRSAFYKRGKILDGRSDDIEGRLREVFLFVHSQANEITGKIAFVLRHSSRTHTQPKAGVKVHV